jgi:predicted transposase YbfD/YdcC
VFTQVKTGETSKGNEVSTITAIPKLPDLLDITGAVVTIDATDSSPRDAGIKERIS